MRQTMIKLLKVYLILISHYKTSQLRSRL